MMRGFEYFYFLFFKQAEWEYIETILGAFHITDYVYDVLFCFKKT
jgi:hypothetical protein